MRIMITGAKGQLGRALQAQFEHDAVLPADLPECDITDRACVDEAIGEFKPDVVIHAAAMTDVDGCARDPDAAYRANALGTQNVALACQRAGCAMVYVSTNEVFDGTQDRAVPRIRCAESDQRLRAEQAGRRNIRPRLADALLHRPHRVAVWQRRQSLCPQDHPPAPTSRGSCVSSRTKSARRRMRKTWRAPFASSSRPARTACIIL